MSEKNQPTQSNDVALDLRDLLVDVESRNLSEYLTVSVSNDGQNTTVSFTTTNTHPETYTTVFYGVAASNLQMLLDESYLISPDHFS